MSAESAGVRGWWETRTGDPQRATLAEWGHRHGVIPAVVPLPHRQYDPFDIVASARRRLQKMPETGASIKASQLMRDVDYTTFGPYGLDTLFFLAGCWPATETARGETIWINPDYVHTQSLDETITDERERIEHLRVCASIGILNAVDIAPRFGMGCDSTLRGWMNRRNIPWQTWREWGKSRIARTAILLHEWQGRSFAEIARGFGTPRNTLVNWRQQYADGWSAPPVPSEGGERR